VPSRRGNPAPASPLAGSPGGGDWGGLPAAGMVLGSFLFHPRYQSAQGPAGAGNSRGGAVQGGSGSSGAGFSPGNAQTHGCRPLKRPQPFRPDPLGGRRSTWPRIWSGGETAHPLRLAL